MARNISYVSIILFLLQPLMIEIFYLLITMFEHTTEPTIQQT